MPFLELTLANKQPLDIPAESVLFLESLDDAGRQAFPGCRSGIFFDLGNGSQNMAVQEPFPKIAKAVQEAAPVRWLQLQRADKGKVLIAAHNIVSLRGLPDDHPNDGRCQITHRITPPTTNTPAEYTGPRFLLVDVIETRNDIKAMLPAPPPAPAAEGERTGDGDDA